MADRNLQDFYRRAGRYERAYARGQGFEAPGSIGRAATQKRARYSVPIFGPLGVLLGVSLMMKAAITMQLGPDLYAERLARLHNGSTAEWIGAVFLAPDPVSTRIASEIRRFF